MSWTPERESKLRDLWSKGHTASQIAEAIGATTRNAVIGKAHRLNLASRTNSLRSFNVRNKDKDEKNKEINSGRVSRKVKFKSLLLDKNFEPENPKSLEQLDDETCRWPLGHPDENDFHFCGRTSEKNFSYCKLHVLYAFQPKNAKEEDVITDEDVPKFIEKKIKSA